MNYEIRGLAAFGVHRHPMHMLFFAEHLVAGVDAEMAWVLQITWRADGEKDERLFGRYVKEYDPFIDPRTDTYKLVVVIGIEDALRFDTDREAANYWNRVSPNVPTRWWDGKPNRPLTAYCCEIHQV